MQESSTVDQSPMPDRLVWVVNIIQVPENGNPNDYIYEEEDRRGTRWFFPPNSEKKVQMRYLACRRFLGKAVALSSPNPDGSYIDERTGLVDKTKFGKPLKMVELTYEEKLKYDPESISEKEKKKFEKILASKNHSENSSGDVESVGKGKPQAQRRRGRPSVKEAATDLAGELDSI